MEELTGKINRKLKHVPWFPGPVHQLFVPYCVFVTTCFGKTLACKVATKANKQFVATYGIIHVMIICMIIKKIPYSKFPKPYHETKLHFRVNNLVVTN